MLGYMGEKEEGRVIRSGSVGDMQRVAINSLFSLSEVIANVNIIKL